MTHLKLYLQFVQQVFSVQFFLLLAAGVGTTITLVFSGLDWQYLLLTQEYNLRKLLFLTNTLGFLLPALVVAGYWALYLLTKKSFYALYVQASLYAILLGFTLATILKAFAGRTSPPHQHGPNDVIQLVDNSTAFNFGFLQEQILGGWPSAHATVMFALATTLFYLLPRHWYTTTVLFGTAVFVGIGVTFGWHWLSEYVAGMCLGIAIGTVVGRHFRIGRVN